MRDLHEFAKMGAKANLERDGEVIPMFFGQTEGGQIYASPCSGYSNREEKERVFLSRMAALRARGAKEFTLVVDTFFKVVSKDEWTEDEPLPSQDPRSKDAILVQSSDGRVSMLVYGRDDSGNIVLQGWDEPEGAVSESWILDAMKDIADMHVPEESMKASQVMEFILNIDIYRLEGV